MRVAALAISAGLALAGCVPTDGDAPREGPATLPAGEERAEGPRDALRTSQQFFQLQFYQLTVPLGSISGNVEFWRPLDETFLGLWQHDVLYKNGVRVGRAPIGELPTLDAQLADAETLPSKLIGTAGKDVEMELRRGVARQTVFAFDAAGNASGRDFVDADNLFVFDFRQVPRRPDHVRLSVAPAVREQGLKLELREGGGGGIDWVRPFTLYQVGISCELGVDECLVIAPADTALQVNVSVGRTFMMEDRPAARVEKVLVIVPRLAGRVQEIAPVVTR